MDRTDLIDTAFRVAGNGGRATRAEAVRTVEAAVIDGERPVASTPTTSARARWSRPPTGCSS
ncbi:MULTISPECIES: hypothetical protein [unclassified Kitasatospora]|uniref:hypothetical protein n=1 Tax=unclassified Kitasatospora TaxID=2633591 RepID=UPI0036AEE664